MESFVIVHNVAKRHNIGTLVRSASAFGVKEFILVGRRDFNSFGSHGSASHVSFRHFYTLPEARQYLKVVRNNGSTYKAVDRLLTHHYPHLYWTACVVHYIDLLLEDIAKLPWIKKNKDSDICGLEIVDGAVAVHEHPFKRSTAFLLGNEGIGLSAKELEICDFFVYIPQYGGGTASLNVTVAASIALHHFAVWAKFSETERDGQKFIVSEKPARQSPRNYCPEPTEDIVKARKIKKESGLADWLHDVSVDAMEDISQTSNPLSALFEMG